MITTAPARKRSVGRPRRWGSWPSKCGHSRTTGGNTAVRLAELATLVPGVPGEAVSAKLGFDQGI